MIPSEYQELADFFVDRIDRHQRETREMIAQSQQELRNHVGALFESLRHEIRLVADGVLETHRRIDENGARIDANTRAIEEHSLRLDANTAAIEDNRKRIDANTRAIEANGARIDANTRAIEANGARIDANTRAIEANGARIDANTRSTEANGVRIDALTQRVERLEGTVSIRFDDHEQRLRILER